MSIEHLESRFDSKGVRSTLIARVDAPLHGCVAARPLAAEVVSRGVTGFVAGRVAAVVIALSALFAPPAARAQTVDDVVAVNIGACTTAGVEGLSEQLVRSHLCAYPGAVDEFAPYSGITLTSSRVHPLAASATVTALHAAADRVPLVVTSAFRTLVQQYMLFEAGGCGLAAEPGRSNHQSGVAVDLSNYSDALSVMLSVGCAHPYPVDDPVHFDCPGPDMRPASVLVFQRLWNLNNPGDPIAEDGAYGPMTGARLGRSPARGFSRDLCPLEPVARWGAEFVDQTFPLASADPIVLRPGQELLGTIELRNVGSTTWNASTRLATTEPRERESLFAGPDWIGPTRADAVAGAVAPGDSYPFTFTLRAPSAPGEYREHFGLVQEGVAWFSDMGQLGPPDDQLELRVLVVEGEPIADGGISDDAGPALDGGVLTRDAGDDGGRAMVRGCACRASARGEAPSVAWWIGATAIVLARLRRRRVRDR